METKETVLLMFAVEEDTGKETLTRYLNMFPEYSSELVHLAWKLMPTEQKNKALDKLYKKIMKHGQTKSPRAKQKTL